MSDLVSLAERVEAGSGPDRELDASILCSIDGWTAREVFGMAGNAYTQYRDYGGMVCAPEPLTNSLDASVALLERVLPLAEWELTTTGVKPGATVIPNGAKHAGSYATSPARALLAATLRALATQEKRNG